MSAPGRSGGAMTAGRPFRGAPGFHGNPGFHGGAGFHGGYGNRHFFNHPHRGAFYYNNGCYNGFCNAYAGYPGYYYAPPIFWSGFDYPASDYGAQSYAAAPAAAPAYDDTGLRLQIQQLTDQVEQLREEQRQRSQPAPQAAPASTSRVEPPTVLVFRDGRVKEVKNYGIVGQTLWIFDEQRAWKVPLADLDLPATRAANDDRGGFVVPGNQ